MRNSDEEILNAVMNVEVDKLVNSDCYARDAEWKGRQLGHYDRSFNTSTGEVSLRMPKLKGLTFAISLQNIGQGSVSTIHSSV